MRRLHQVCIARQCHLVHRLQMHKVALTGMRTSSQNYKCFKDTCSFFKLASLGITYMHVYVLFVRCKNASLVQTHTPIHIHTITYARIITRPPSYKHMQTYTPTHLHSHTHKHTLTLTRNHTHTHSHTNTNTHTHIGLCRRPWWSWQGHGPRRPWTSCCPSSTPP
jgi:hypothetical protein